MSTVEDSPVTILPFSKSSDGEVQLLLKQYKIGLTIEEARKIVGFLERDPTLVEAVIWGIQGSEHCSYKSSRRFFKNFLTNGKHVILGPVEDSGIVAITDEPTGKRWGLVISHESHNHPSQIVPYEGAATGVGGTVRDVLCMGARVVGVMDMLRLGDLQTEESKTIAKEVVRGIGGYGNPLGVPNVGGDTIFDSSYNSNCLVNAIALGIVREDEIIHSYVPEEAGEVGYDIIIVGKPTDRSGFGGASFASASMEEEKKEQNFGAVQEPNPFLERHLLASSYALFDWLAAKQKLHKVSFKDLGAGGIVSSSVEQVSDRGFGAEISLDNVHTSLENLPPEVIACAETQERFCWMCHPDLTEHILDHYNKTWDLPSVAEHAGARVIGKVTTDGIYRLTYRGRNVCEAKAKDITSGLQYERPTKLVEYKGEEPNIVFEDGKIVVESRRVEESNVSTSRNVTFDFTTIFKSMLAHPNGCSRELLFKHFDKTVMGNSVIEAGEADAGVIAPLQDLSSYVLEGSHPGWDLSDNDAWKGIAFAADGNGRYGRISPYWQGANAAIEAICNVVAVGATPRALTDCLNYGNPEIPEQLAMLEEGVRGIADVSKQIVFQGEGVPVISGNVSLYNGKPDGSAIDPTAIVCCVGILTDARTACTMQIKKENSSLLLVGKRPSACGGSLYYQVLEEMIHAKRDTLLGVNLPMPDFQEIKTITTFVLQALKQDLILSCHDISDGGLLMSLFEMTLPQRKRGGAIGVKVDLEKLMEFGRVDEVLFSQSEGFVIEIDGTKKKELETIASGLDCVLTEIGKTTTQPLLTICNNKTTLIQEDLQGLQDIWRNGLLRAL